MYMCRKLFWQGLKKVPSSGPGQVDFVAGQVTFQADLQNKQGSRQSWITKKKSLSERSMRWPGK